MFIELNGRVGLVTGAASGIGRAAAVALGRRGAHVVVADLESQQGNAKETLDEVAAAGGTAELVELDVTSDEQWAAVMVAIRERHGRLDFAHNNAGISLAAPFLETTSAQLSQIMAVNLTGVWLGLQRQVPLMVEQGYGSIVNTASLAGLRGLTMGAAYSASKHAVVGLTRSVAIETANQGVRVNCICPAAVDTPMLAGLPDDLREEIVAPQAIKRFARPREIGEAVAWLCSDASSFITGAALPVDGGATAG